MTEESIARMIGKGIQYIHLQTKANGGVTLALQADDFGALRIGAAFCSPAEPSFNRKLGRLIANGRLFARRHGYTFVFGACSAKDLLEHPAELLEVLTRLSTRGYCSDRKKAQRGPVWWPDFIKAMRRQLNLFLCRLD